MSAQLLLDFIISAVIIGVGATLIMDLWALMLKRFFNIAPLNFVMVGRWLGHLFKGRFSHNNIGNAAAISAEAAIGWFAHYFIGVIFAAALLLLVGDGWLTKPTLFSGLAFGMATVIFPFFIMQPGMGLGIAASKTPKPNIARLRSLTTHLVFGFGLYISALFYAFF